MLRIIQELAMCERIKTDLLRGLALRCAHLKGITELSKAIGAKVCKKVEKQMMDILLLSNSRKCPPNGLNT